MKYILDHGEDQDTVTFTSVWDAWKALDDAGSDAKLYLRKSAKEWQIYVDKHAVNPDNLPIKVLEA